MLTLNDGRTELWQWDTGRTLAVDADCSQVHFSNKVFGRSIDVDVAGGVAIIPDILLQTDKDLNVWAFVGTAENGYTKISKIFTVNRRNKPADYVFTPVEQTTIDEIAAIAQSVRDDADAGLFNGEPGDNGITPHIGDNGNWYLGETDTGKPSRGEPGPAGADGKDGDQGPRGDTGATPNLQIGTVTTLEAGEDASASISGTPEEPRLNLGIPKGPKGEAGSGGGADLSLGLAGASERQSAIIKTVDSDGKPTAWEAAELAKADGSNISATYSVMDTWRTKIGALSGTKIYGKADANGKIMAYSDAACTEAVGQVDALGLVEYGNALLIFDHKTYQCVGFSESQYVPGYFTVAYFFRAEIATTGNTSVYHVEHAVLDIERYLYSEIDAPIKITAGDIPMTTTTTT